ncbi:MAG: glutamate 5-kinase [Clostridiales bacterium]|jgi:glutamate 5-kinase|nr:glutamate 5-kinase [Clostridiales bacterium]
MAKRDFSRVKRIIIKIGTTSLTYPNGRINLRRIERIAWVLTDLRNQGKEVILVTSAAIAVGTERLGLSERPREIRDKQAASAVGQAVLMQFYENFFMTYNQKVAQILLTKDVTDDAARRSHARNTIDALLKMGVIPIVNENDTISDEELGFSDNDSLSAFVAVISEADCLIMLSDIDGLFTVDPRLDKDAALIPFVERITDDIIKIGGDSFGKLGTGGMAAKISAAGIAVERGIDVIIASGEDPAALFGILNGEIIGTMFMGRR